MSAIDKARLQLSKCTKCVGCLRLDDEGFRGDEHCMRFVDASTKKEDLIREYNAILKRCHKAIEYMEDLSNNEAKDKYHREFLKLWHRLEDILWDFDAKGYEYTEREIEFGFKEVT